MDEADAIGNLGTLLEAGEDPAGAIPLYEKARVIYREIDWAPGECFLLGQMGTSWAVLAEPVRARACLEGQLELARALGERGRESLALSALGCLARADGRPEEARALDEEALRLAVANRDAYVRGCSKAHLAADALAEGRADAPVSLLGEALEIHRSHGIAVHDGQIQLQLGDVAFERGDACEARRCYRAATEILAEQPAGMVGLVVRTSLALVGEADPRAITVPSTLSPEQKMGIHVKLWRAGGGEEHLARARKLLQLYASRLPAEARDAFWSRSDLLPASAREALRPH